MASCDPVSLVSFWRIPTDLTCDISCFRYGNKSFVDERHRHRYEVCCTDHVLNFFLYAVVAYYISCKDMVLTLELGFTLRR